MRRLRALHRRRTDTIRRCFHESLDLTPHNASKTRVDALMLGEGADRVRGAAVPERSMLQPSAQMASRGRRRHAMTVADDALAEALKVAGVIPQQARIIKTERKQHGLPRPSSSANARRAAQSRSADGPRCSYSLHFTFFTAPMSQPSTALAALGGRNNIRCRARQAAGIALQTQIRSFTAVERRLGSEPGHFGRVHSILLLVELTLIARQHLRDWDRKLLDEVAGHERLAGHVRVATGSRLDPSCKLRQGCQYRETGCTTRPSRRPGNRQPVSTRGCSKPYSL